MPPDLEGELGALIFLGATLVVGSAVLGLPLLSFARRRLAPDRFGPVRWGLVDLAAAVFAFLLGTLAAGAFADPEEPLSLLLAGTVGFLALGVSVWVSARRVHAEPWRALGLGGRPWILPTCFGMLLVAVTLPGVLGLAILWNQLLVFLGVEVQLQEVVLMAQELAGAELVAYVFIAVVLAPFLEELAFRGFLQAYLVRVWGPLPGLVATAFLFASSHGLGPLVPLFALALLLGAMMLRTRSLLAGWAMHALFNAWNVARILYLPETPG